MAACMKRMSMEVRIRGIPAVSEIRNRYQHLMARLVDMGLKGIVQGEASQGNLENVETETTGVKGSGKGNIDNLSERARDLMHFD